MADGTQTLADGLGIKVVDSIQVHKNRQQFQVQHLQQSNVYPQRQSGSDYTTPTKFSPRKYPNLQPTITIESSIYNPRSGNHINPKLPQPIWDVQNPNQVGDLANPQLPTFISNPNPHSTEADLDLITSNSPRNPTHGKSIHFGPHSPSSPKSSPSRKLSAGFPARGGSIGF